MPGVDWRRILVFRLVVLFAVILSVGVPFLLFGGRRGTMGPGGIDPRGRRGSSGGVSWPLLWR